MGWLRWLFLESFVALASVLFLANFVLLVHWRRSGRPRALLIGLASAIMLLAVQALVVTRHEHAARTLHAIVAEIPLRRVDVLSASLTADFDCDGMDRDAFVKFAQAGLDRVRIEQLHRTLLEVVRSQGDEFAVEVVYLSDTLIGDVFEGYLKSRWEVTFVRRAGEWRIGGIRALEINNTPVGDISELRP